MFFLINLSVVNNKKTVGNKYAGLFGEATGLHSRAVGMRSYEVGLHF